MSILRMPYLGVLAALLSAVNSDTILGYESFQAATDYEFQNYTAQQCQAPYDASNATGTVLVDPFTANEDMNDVSWTVTVTQPYNEGIGVTNVSLYLGTPSGFDLRPGNLNFSACALLFEGLGDNLNRRGQDDDGGCEQMFSKECVAAISRQASVTGYYLTADPTDNYPAPGNLTAGSLPRVCQDIVNAMTSTGAVPQECAQFVGPSLSWYDRVYSNISMQAIEITGPNSTSDVSCSFNTTTLSSGAPAFPVPKSNLTYVWEWRAKSGPNNSTQLYDNATQAVIPLLMVYFPPANDSRSDFDTLSGGFMNCVRANNSLPGSRVSPPLPAATPLRKLPHKLRKGAIAGIVVGCVVGIAGLAGLCVWFCLRRRKTRRAEQEKAEANRKEIELENVRKEDEIKKEALQPNADSNPIYEIGGRGGHGEMDTGLVSELDGSGVAELGGSKR